MRAATSYAISVHWLLLRPVLVRSKCLSEAVIVSIPFRGKLWSSSLPSSVFLRFKDFASFKTHLSVRYLCCHQETQRQRESMKRISTISLKAQSCNEPATSESTWLHLNHFVCVWEGWRSSTRSEACNSVVVTRLAQAGPFHCKALIEKMTLRIKSLSRRRRWRGTGYIVNKNRKLTQNKTNNIKIILIVVIMIKNNDDNANNKNTRKQKKQKIKVTSKILSKPCKTTYKKTRFKPST